MVSLFTREEGKIMAVARGVRKPRAKLAGALQHFTLLDMHLAPSRRFDVITQARVLNPFYGLRTKLEAFSYACYFAELFEASLEERQRQPVLFDLLVDALARLVDGEMPDMLARYVEINLVGMLGYLPHLTDCATCQTPLSHPERGWPTWLGFSASQGGALCPDCLPRVPGAKRIAAGTAQVAHLLLARGLEGLHGVQLSDRLRREVESTFRDYLEYRLEKRLNSGRFIHEWDGDNDSG